ncbi:MAG: glycosyltransferase [Candidatus Delongbacteria bacterium]|nr:glycosyltransferase [Candidatus Delongbacteria bacterium]
MCLISVIMPVYNGEMYLAEAIDSILNQTFRDFEFIIINDGSSDKTEEIVLSYSDIRIIYISNVRNLGIAKALNKGISLARGKYIARMDSDDISLAKRFEMQYIFMEKNQDIDICGSWIKAFWKKNEIWKYPSMHEAIKVNMLFNSSIAHPVAMIRKSFFNEFKYDDNYDKAEDYFLWVRTIKSHKFHNIKQVLLKYRIHDLQTEKREQLEQTNNIRRFLLNSIGFVLDANNLNIFFKIANYQNVTIQEAESITSKLLKENDRLHFFDHSELLFFLKQRVLYSITQGYKSRIIFCHYLSKSNLRDLLYPSKIDYVIFLIKKILWSS